MYQKMLLLVLCFLCLISKSLFAEIDPASLLKPEEAFAPQIINQEQGAILQFNIAKGYYLYRSKIDIQTEPTPVFSSPSFLPGVEKHDEFFGTQDVYYDATSINLPYLNETPPSYQITLSYQGCADVGICYPPTQSTFTINSTGIFSPAGLKPQNLPVFKDIPFRTPKDKPSVLNLSWQTLTTSLLVFFLSGIALSFTACMYPLLPIVSSIIMGKDHQPSKTRAFSLSFVYVQGLALTYAVVGVIAGVTGALLSVFLQQAWVILSASFLMLLLALSMFGVFTLQIPLRLQNFFSGKSQGFSGGQWLSVFMMGALSALIIGPCMAPPLAAALTYIAQTGDATLGALALYVLALGTGLPLIAVTTFGVSFLPKAGPWMTGVRVFFGCLLLAAAIYLATPFLPYPIIVALYTLLLLVPGGLLLSKVALSTGILRHIRLSLGIILVFGSLYFAYNSIEYADTPLHQALTLTHPKHKQHDLHPVYTQSRDLNHAIANAFKDKPNEIVFVDFYADWCVSCKKMSAYTFNQDSVQDAIDMDRFFQIDVTGNTEDHQKLLKEYGLFGPPGLFILSAPHQKSAPLLGYAEPEALIHWINTTKTP